MAGGQGQRLGGKDKGLVEVQGLPMVAHAIERFSPQVSALAISANRHLSEYSKYGYDVLTDKTNDFDGPLAGIAVGLAWCPTSLLAVIPCDSPGLPRDLVATLFSGMQAANKRLAMATVGGYRQPVFALIGKELAVSLMQFLDAGERKIGKWYEMHEAAEIAFPDAAAFANINTEQQRSAFERDKP